MPTRTPERIVEPGPQVDPVFEGIREAILKRKLPPGTKLHEEALAGIFGVSRTRIRVAQPSIKEARDMFAIRRLIEPAVAADVAARFTPQVGKTLKDVMRAEHNA